MAHTPGPWRATRLGASVLSGKKLVAFLYHMDLDETRQANARLIAAAPDLLAACEDLLLLVVQCQTALESDAPSLFPGEADLAEAEKNGRVAIAKAKGS